MPQLDPGSFAVQSAREIVVCFVALHNLVLLISHGAYIVIAPDAYTNKIHLLSLWAIILFTAASVCYVLVPWMTVYNHETFNLPITPSLCKWIIFSSKLSFIYTKTVGLYYVYVEQLIHIFKGNVYGFKKWQILCMRGMVVLITIMWTLAALATAERGHKFSPMNNRCIGLVFPGATSLPLFFSIAVDFGFCTLITTVYCRRLLFFMVTLNTTRLLHHSPSLNAPNAPHQEADKLYFKIMVKSTVLTFAASLSTQLSLVLSFALGMPTMWVALDSMVSCWCLILIFDLNENVYTFCCCICEKLICYHCIVCYSCHCCYRVNMGISNNLRLRIRSVHHQAIGFDANDARGNIADPNRVNVDLQMTVVQRPSVPYSAVVAI